MSIDMQQVRQKLHGFDFKNLFIEELGWSQPSYPKPIVLEWRGAQFEQQQITHLAGVVVFEIESHDGKIPDTKSRAAIHKEISQQYHENLLIFLDKKRTQSLWYWVKREGTKRYPREHLYVKGQPGDLFLSKITAMFFDMGELDEHGNVSVIEVAQRLQKALDVEPVTKKFYTEYRDQHILFLKYITGIDNERDRQWYASVLLNRLMFIYFLQRKGFVDEGNLDYLQDKLVQSKTCGANLYYSTFLKTLFFEGFAKPLEQRSDIAKALLGNIVYLNGGLFLPHSIEIRWPHIVIADEAFENLLSLFSRYSWNLDDTPGGKDDEINPDVLGYIFEKYINQKAFGAYYTRTEITEYLCEQTIHQLILEKINTPGIPGVVPPIQFDSIPDLLMNLDAPLCRKILFDVLPNLSLLDPACGSGAFLVAAMKKLIDIYSAVTGRIEYLSDTNLSQRLKTIRAEHPSLHYYIKKRIITDNLFGVDIMEEATEIARLRLFLALVSSVQTVDQLEPLPNIDFNTLTGNSLIGLMHINDEDFEQRDSQWNLFRRTYHEILAEKNRLIENYRHAATYANDLRVLRDDIQQKKTEVLDTLNAILLDEFKNLGIKFEQATWDAAKKQEGKPIKRALTSDDIEVLRPFHWGYEFDQILNERGGFDAIITNPPWEIFKPQAKEFFSEHSTLVTKNKMTIKDFEKEQAKLLQNPEIRAAWLEYQSRFPFQSLFFRSAKQYANQISMINGKKAGTDINLYKLFVEQCYNLLREGGQCGIVIPSGIYTDLGTKQLRELLFTQGRISGLFCFENRKGIFENVDSRFKFVVLTFEKGGSTEKFPSAFMRHDVAELGHFPKQGALPLSVDLIRRLSPDSLSIMEFKTDLDVVIAEKMLKSPLLGSDVNNSWKFELANEFHMRNDSHLFRTSEGKNCPPLFTGKMFWQFSLTSEHSGYWIDEREGRRALLGSEKDVGQKLDYQCYRWVHRRIASNTNERTLITTISPRKVFTEVNSTVAKVIETGITNAEMLFLCAMTNSFSVDWFLRAKVSTTLNMFYIYQLPVPRLTEADAAFRPIMERAARLICTTSEFDDLAREVGLGSHKKGATAPEERARLRAELDGLIAHLYGLTEMEFSHVLATFPLVGQSVKDAALDAYRAFAPKPEDQELLSLIAKGESADLELKASSRWDMKENKMNKELERVIIKTVAAFLNVEKGGTLLIGVDDSEVAVGLQHDYKTLGKKQDHNGYENFLMTLFLDACGKECSPFLKINFCEVQGKDVCRVTVNASPKPVFIKDDKGEHLYIRAGNSTRLLTTKEALEYCKIRWK